MAVNWSDFEPIDGPKRTPTGVDWSQFTPVKNEPRGIASEVGSQLVAGAAVDLPSMVGRAMQWMGEEGGKFHESGRELVESAQAREEEHPWMKAQTEGRSLPGKALSMGARALAPSLAAGIPALAAAPLGVPAAIGAGVASTAGLFGTSQAQETYENIKKAGGSEEDARNAGYINGLIEAGGEAVGSFAGMKLLGIGAKAIGAALTPVQAAIRGGTEAAVWKPFAKQLPKTAAIESATEFGQNFGEATVEQRYGVEGKHPLEEGGEGALAALGMTALLAPFGLGGFAMRAKRNERVANALTDPDADVANRIAAAKIINDGIADVSPEAAKAWSRNAAIAIDAKAPILLDEEFTKPEAGDAITTAKREAAEAQAAAAKIAQAKSADEAIAAALAAAEAPVKPGTPIDFSQTDVDLGRAEGAHGAAQEKDAAQVAQELAGSIPFEKRPITPVVGQPGQVAPSDFDRAQAELEARKQADFDKMQSGRRDVDAEAAIQASLRAEREQKPAQPPNQAMKEALVRAYGARVADSATDVAKQATSETGTIVPKSGTAPEVNVRGKPIGEMTDAELQAAAAEHPMSASRHAAQVELDRRSAQKAEAAKSSPIAPAVAPVAPAAVQPAAVAEAPRIPPAPVQPPAAPALIMGKALDQVTKGQLQIAAKRGKTKAVRQAAQAELERRAEESNVEVPADMHDDLRAIASTADWASEGGKAMGPPGNLGTYVGGKYSGPETKTREEMNEEGTGRTTWFGMPEWAQGMGMNKEDFIAAAEKAIAGKPLGKKQRIAVQTMIEEIQAIRAIRSEAQAVAVQAEGQKPDNWATLSEAEQEDELDKIFGADTRPGYQGPRAQSAETRPSDSEGALEQTGERQPGEDDDLDAPARADSPQDAVRAGTDGSQAQDVEGRQGEDDVQAAGGNSSTVAVKQRLFVERGTQRVEVESLEDAARKWGQFFHAAVAEGAGSESVSGAKVVDQDGKEVARISQNGRVWPPGEWKAGVKPLVEAIHRTPDERPSLALDQPTEASLRAKETQAREGQVEERTAAVRDRNEAILSAPAGTAPPRDVSENPVPTVQKALFSRAKATTTDAFKRWFGNSKVVDKNGDPLVVVHGAKRLDRMGPVIYKGRATSGPMPFFTDDTGIASSYATSKSDTSLPDEDRDYNAWFRLKVPGARKPVNIDRAWFFLPTEQREKIAELAPRVGRDYETGENLILHPEGERRGLGGYDQHIKEARGNHLRALVEEWLSSGSLYDQEEVFLGVLKLAGVDAKVEMHSPWAEFPGVLPVYLSIQNPLRTNDIPQSVVDALQRRANRQSTPKDFGSDPWDKGRRDPREWMADLKKDIAEGKNTHAWTSIPDWVTDTLKDLGYDGIIDRGGKMGGQEHGVYIPFEPTQIKSAIGNRGTFDPTKRNILFSRKPTFSKDEAGRPLLSFERLSLVEPRTLSGMFGFGGGTPVQHKIAMDGRDVGVVTLNWKDGKVRDLLYILVLDGQQGQGIGEEVVRGILQHNGGPLRAVHVLPKARGFWEKMGAEFVQLEDGEDGILTLENYQDARGPLAEDGRQGGAGPAAFRESQERPGDAEKSGQALSKSAVGQAIAPVLAKWKNAPEVVVLESMDEAPEAVRMEDEGQRSGGATGSPEGFYWNGKVYLVADTLSTPEAAIRTLLHESLGHFGLRSVFGEKLNPILDDVARSLKGRVQAKAKEYGLDFGNVDDKRKAAEEVLAELAQTMPNASVVQRLIALVREFLRSVGIDVEMSEKDIVARYILPARGFVERGGKTEAIASAPSFGRDQTLSEAFRKWFGQSKVVDEEGKPMAVYHGTADSFSEFELDRPNRKDTGWLGRGFYFTNDPEISNSYANLKAGAAANVMPVYLSLENPYYATIEEKRRIQSAEMRGDVDAAQKRTDELRAKGHDGIILRYSHTENGLKPVEYVVFDAAQIKSAIGNRGTFDAKNQDIRFSRAAWIDQQPAETQEALRKAGVWYTPPTLKERVAVWKTDWLKRVRQGMVDQFDPIKTYDYKAYMLARMTRSADAALEAMLNYGTIKLDSDGAVEVNFENGGFLKILKSLKGEHERFLAWVIGNRAERLKSEGREHNFTDADIQRLKALNQGQLDGSPRAALYAQVRADMDRYNKSVLDMAERAGLIDADSRSTWEKDFYVPFYRLSENEHGAFPVMSKGLVNQYAFKVLKGGEKELGDPLENVLRNWSHLIDASLKNQAARASILAAERVGAVVESDSETARQMAKAIDSKRGAVSFTDQGVQRWFVVEDPFLLDALRSIGFTGFSGPAMQVMGKFKKWLTMGVTVSPTFRIRNVIRDSIQMIGTNPASYNVLQNVLTGWKATKEGSPEFASLLAGGGVMRFGTLLEGDRAEHVKKLIESGVERSTILDKPKHVKAMLTQAWDWWQHVGDRAENVNRAALYKTLRAKGKTHLEASFAARDTMDFSMQGTWAAIRFLSQTVPFMNARIQGLYKLGRGAAEDPRRFGIVVGAATMATLALMLAYKDDDDWKQREDWDRETFWWFKIGDKAFRIPKPFEIGAIATLAERGLEAMITDDLTGKQFASRVYSILENQLSLNPVPQLAKPLIEVYANRDSFTDRPIESMGMERLSKSERSSPNTSPTAQLLGKNGIVSPVQIDHLVRGYFGWLGAHIVSTSDLALRPAMGLPPNPAWKVDDVLVAGDFVKDLPQPQSKYMTRLYDQMKDVQEAMADLRHYQKIGATEKAHEILQDKGDKIRLFQLYNHAEQQLAAVNRQIKMVQLRSGDADEKRERLDGLYATRNRIARVTEEAAQRRSQ